MNKKPLAAIFVAYIVFVIIVVVTLHLTAVNFADSNLEAAVRDAIGRPQGPIFTTDLKELISFHPSGGNITSLAGLESCTNLTEFHLSCSQIDDILPLANLTDLTRLYLMDNQISNISPLVDNEGLSEGDEVYLSGNPLSSDSINIYIPQLEARGVFVDY